MNLMVKVLFLVMMLVLSFSVVDATKLRHDLDTSLVGSQVAASEREIILNNLVELLSTSSQRNNADSIKRLIEQLRTSGICILEGTDEVIRPACVGLQCLFEEMFISKNQNFKRADFEIHTTMPATPCCKLPNKKTKETFLASFKDEKRLVTIDGRSIALDVISDLPHAKLHLTFTKKGYDKRSQEEQEVLMDYWAPKVNMTCLESCEAFSSKLNGATYRLLLPSDTEIFFGIQASQASQTDSKFFVVHLGTRDQPEIKTWLDDLEKKLEGMGRILFKQEC